MNSQFLNRRENPEIGANDANGLIADFMAINKALVIICH